MKDPLQQAVEGAPNANELWLALTRRMEGMPIDQVYTIAVNMIVQAIRMTTPTRAGAEFVVDDLHRRAKALTLAHYDSANGKRKTVFPYTQVIQAPFHVEDDVIFHG